MSLAEKWHKRDPELVIAFSAFLLGFFVCVVFMLMVEMVSWQRCKYTETQVKDCHEQLSSCQVQKTPRRRK